MILVWVAISVVGLDWSLCAEGPHSRPALTTLVADPTPSPAPRLKLADTPALRPGQWETTNERWECQGNQCRRGKRR